MSSKSRKASESGGIATQLPLIVKTGKYLTGYRQVLRSIQHNTCKYLIITKNYPPLKKMELEYNAVLGGKVPVCIVDGTNTDLANICSAIFRMGVISIIDEGEADLALT